MFEGISEEILENPGGFYERILLIKAREKSVPEIQEKSLKEIREMSLEESKVNL